MFSSHAAADDTAVAELIQQTDDAANAWLRGDMDRYLEIVHHARGFTLIAPDGGPPVQHADRRGEFAGWRSPFADGEASLEVTAAHVFDDVVVLVMIERQHGRVADLPDQDLSMRVTQIYRRVGAGWELVHRHADPLVRPIPPPQLAALLRE